MSNNFKLIDEIHVGNSLGEGVQWRAHDQSFWWTDILENKLYQYQWPAKKLTVFDLPESLGSFAFTDDPDAIIAAFASGFAFFNWITGEIKWLHKPDFLPGEDRFNDGRVDRQGRFWSGTMIAFPPQPNAASGRLFCLGLDYGLSVHEQNIAISNGIGWSPDGTTLYYADSPTGNIYRYDVDTETGTISNKSLFVRVPLGGGPDGAAVDAQGNVWSAQWAASKILAFNPDGDIIDDVPVSASQPACAAFGGPNLDLLIVTSARDDLSSEQLENEPSAGNVFIFQTDISGLPEETYKGRVPSLRT